MQQIEKAIDYMDQGNAEEAINCLQDHLQTANDDERFTIAQLYMQWGMIQDSVKLMEELYEKYPFEQDVILVLSELYIDLQEDEKAIDLLNQIDEDDENFLQVLVQLADLYQTQGLFEVAEQKLLQAKQLAPNEAVIDFALGELAFYTGEYLKSIPYYEQAYKKQKEFGESEVALRLAEAYATKGDFKEALDYFKASSDQSPDVLFRYGFTAFQGNRLDIAITVWNKLLDEDPYYNSVYPLLAQAYESENMLEEAYETAQQGLKKDEFNKELYHLAGTLAHKLGLREEAYEYVKQAVSIDPGYKEAILFLVEAYKDAQELDKVEDLLTYVMEHGEEDSMYDWELARIYNELESFDQALSYYDKAYNGFKDDADFLKEYGYFLIEEGRVQKARTVLEKYLAIETTDTEVEEFLSRLGNNEL